MLSAGVEIPLLRRLLVMVHVHGPTGLFGDGGRREEIIQNRNRLLDFGGKQFKIEIDSSVLAGRNSK